MLKYTSLFRDLEELFRSTDRHPASFRRLAREVERASEDVRDYHREVAAAYVEQLVRRLAQPEARLSPDEVQLVRGFLALPPDDPERERRLVDDLGRLEECVRGLGQLAGEPLSIRNLGLLQRWLQRMRRTLPRIVDALEDLAAIRAFEAAAGLAGDGELDREWLQAELTQALLGTDEGQPLPRAEPR